MTIHNDQISYVKHVLAPNYVFLILFGCWGGSQGGYGTTCLCSFIALATKKWSSLSPLRGALPKAIEFRMNLKVWHTQTVNSYSFVFSLLFFLQQLHVSCQFPGSAFQITYKGTGMPSGPWWPRHASKEFRRIW